MAVVATLLATGGVSEAKDRTGEKAFHGDGTLFRSYPMPLFIGRWLECGYGVSFGSFPTGSEHEAEYEIGPLPDRLDRNFEVVLALDGANVRLEEGWSADFVIEDAGGTVVLQSEDVDGGSWPGGGFTHVFQMLPEWRKRRVSGWEYIFSAPMGGTNLRPAAFKAQPGQRYRVKVRYSPGTGAPETQGHFEIRQPVSM